MIEKEVGSKLQTRHISSSTFGSTWMCRVATPTIGDGDDLEDDLVGTAM